MTKKLCNVSIVDRRRLSAERRLFTRDANVVFGVAVRFGVRLGVEILYVFLFH